MAISAEPRDPLAPAALARRAGIRCEQAGSCSEGAVADSVRVAAGWRFGVEPQVGD